MPFYILREPPARSPIDLAAILIPKITNIIIQM